MQLFSNSYDDNHRVIAQDDSVTNNQPIQLSYQQDSQTGQRQTTTTNRLGQRRLYTFNNDYRLHSLTDEQGHSVDYRYNELGQRLSTDGNGNTTFYQYDNNGNLKTITDANQNQTHLTYDADNHLRVIENALGKRMSFDYDENHRLTSMTDPLGNVTRYSYNVQGQVLTQTTPREGVTHYDYENGYLVQVTDSEGVVYRLGYDAAGRLTRLTDADNNTTTLSYDGNNRLILVTNPLNHSVSMTYNRRDQLQTFTDANGNVTTRHYEGNGNLVSQINALGLETRYQYDGEDRLTQIIDAKGRVTKLGYDLKGRLTHITNPLGQTLTLEYDAADNLIKRVDALGQLVMSLNYNPLNQPTEVSDALQNTSRLEYDALSRITKTTDSAGRITQFAYDDLNRLVESIDALLGSSSQSFDADGHRDRLTDPNSNQTRFDFDKSGRLVQETLATSDSVKYSYNARNLLAQVTNGRGQQRQFEYDALGRITRWTDPEGSVSYSYDANGNVLTVTDSHGTMTREYDKLNRVTKYTDSQGNTLQYAYDEVGNLVTLTYPDGKQVHYAYNDADQLLTVIDWAGRETHYSYDPNGRLNSVTRPNGTKMRRRYDAAGQLLQLKDIVVATGIVLSQFDFSYDAAGNIVEEKTRPEADPDITLEMTYLAANRLATVNEQRLQFDADGNMTKGVIAGELVDLVFDSRNRLTKAGKTVYRYDAENLRVGVNETGYVINSLPVLSQVLVKTQADGISTYYVHGLGLIGQEQEGEYLTYHFDLRGSTVALTDETGTVVERFQYSPYGMLLGGDASKTPFLFNGMYGVMTDNNGLYYMRARYYSPQIRRFVNQDILLGSVVDGQTLNRYAYVTGRPVSYVDPFGLAQVLVVAIGQTKIYYNPTVAELVDVIESLPDSSLLYFRITGHGNPGQIYLMRNGIDFINGYAIVDGKHVPKMIGYDSQENTFYSPGRLDKILKDKLHPQARIEFAGCNTAEGDDNLAKWVSLLLPEILVTGGATYQLGYIEGFPFIPFDGPNGLLGWKTTYITIGSKTHEWTFFSFFE